MKLNTRSQWSQDLMTLLVKSTALLFLFYLQSLWQLMGLGHVWYLTCGAVVYIPLFVSHFCRWCWNTRTKSGTSSRLSKKLLVALLRTLFREVTFTPNLPVMGQTQFLLLEDVFLLLLLDSSQWESRRNFTDCETEARIMWILFQQLAHGVADFFFQKELTHHCGM